MRHWLNEYGLYDPIEIKARQKEINVRKAKHKREFDKNFTLIKELYDQHKTFGQIGLKLNFTRNKIAGIVWRAIKNGMLERRVK